MTEREPPIRETEPVDERIPEALQETLRLYADAVMRALAGGVEGIYVHGSIALEAFDPRTSDVDFVTVTSREPTAEDVARLRTLHGDLRGRTKWGRRLEGVYVPRGSLATAELHPLAHGAQITHPSGLDGASRFPYFSGGRYLGAHRLGAVACALLRERAVVLAGEQPVSVFPEVPREALDTEMRYNLDAYWRGRTRRPHLFLFDEMVDFALTTLPRILYTLETGAIISKPRALPLLPDRFPSSRWLVEDCLRRTSGARGSLDPIRRVSRARATIRLVREVIAHARVAYPRVPARHLD